MSANGIANGDGEGLGGYAIQPDCNLHDAGVDAMDFALQNSDDAFLAGVLGHLGQKVLGGIVRVVPDNL